MPSSWHDAVTQLFHDDPGLGPRLIRQIGGRSEVPGDLPASIGSPEFNDRTSVNFYADAVVVVEGPPRDPVCGVIVEPQMNKDKGKLEDWPRYAAAFWLQTRKPAWVLVVCRSQAVADWYDKRQPITTSLHDYRLPLVILGPVRIPAITDPAQMAADMAADMAAGVLSFTMHGDSPAVAAAFQAGLASLSEQALPSYYEIAHSMSSSALRRILEGFMTSSTIISSPFAKHHYELGLTEGKAEGRAQGEAEGRAQGEAEAILLVLNSRGIPVSEEQQARFINCTDLERLRNWLECVASVRSTDELFD
jgi:hypothetical protein